MNQRHQSLSVSVVQRPPIARRKDEQWSGEYRTRQLIMEAWGRMGSPMRTAGQRSSTRQQTPFSRRCWICCRRSGNTSNGIHTTIIGPVGFLEEDTGGEPGAAQDCPLSIDLGTQMWRTMIAGLMLILATLGCGGAAHHNASAAANRHPSAHRPAGPHPHGAS